MTGFRGQSEAILASLSFGIAPFFAKKGYLSGLHPLGGIAIAISTGFLVNILFVLFSGELKRLASTKRQGLFFALLAGGCNTIAVVTYFWAVAIGKVALVVPITCTYPLFTLVAAYVFFGKSEVIDRWTVIGTLLIVGGVILTV